MRSIFKGLGLALFLSVFTCSMAVATQIDQSVLSKVMTPVKLIRAATDPDLQIIDIRAEKRLSSGTIPGAIWMTYKSWRGPKERPGMPPSAEKLSGMLGDAGIRLDRPIAIFNHSGGAMQTGQAAFVYWLLKTAGAENISILHGGFKAWEAAEMPVANTHIERPAQLVNVEYEYTWWADPMEIFAVVSRQKEGAILDARFEKQIRRSVETGKPLMSIPLARYMPVSFLAENLTEERMSYEHQMAYRTMLEDRGVNLNGDVLISICQTGELSALSWFYASEVVNIENVQYYPDALHGWKADGGVMFGLDPNK